MSINIRKNYEFRNQGALKTIQQIIDEASAATQNKSRTISQSTIPELLAKANIIGPSGIEQLSDIGITSKLADIDFPILTTGPIIPVLAMHQHLKLKKTKELCYREAIRKQNVIMKALSEETDADQSRLEYLTALSTLLHAAIHDLKHNLGY